jgi:alginate O-acetyltransferase complex protein AlgI
MHHAAESQCVPSYGLAGRREIPSPFVGNPLFFRRARTPGNRFQSFLLKYAVLFNSLAFLLLFLPVVLVGAHCLRGVRLLRWITLSSFVFYAFAGHWWFLIPMLITTCVDFYIAQFIQAAPALRVRRRLLFASLIGNLGLLFYFKYSRLLIGTAGAAYALVSGHGGNPAWLKFFEVVLPAGISFYTFQTLSYVIDVYRGQAPAERNFWMFACFVSFFPHLVAGPLTRHNQLIPALQNIAASGVRSRWRDGVFLFSVGLVKKVLIADRIGNGIDTLLGHFDLMGFSVAWVALIGYALQIYFDFSGYSDMAIGLGRLFGVELPQNFNSPYKASNPSEFWRRWHITLSRWLKDYLYITLGGNRCSPARTRLNLMITMVLGGLWHGASWTFAFWGFYHGALLILYHATEHWWDQRSVALQRLATFVLVTLGWVFFRAHSMNDAGQWLAGAFGFHGWGTLPSVRLLGMVSASLVICQVCRNASSFRGYATLAPLYQYGLGVVTAAAIVMMNYSSKFLYFQF